MDHHQSDPFRSIDLKGFKTTEIGGNATKPEWGKEKEGGKGLKLFPLLRFNHFVQCWNVTPATAEGAIESEPSRSRHPKSKEREKDSQILLGCIKSQHRLSVRFVGVNFPPSQCSNTRLKRRNKKCEILMHPSNIRVSHSCALELGRLSRRHGRQERFQTRGLFLLSSRGSLFKVYWRVVHSIADQEGKGGFVRMRKGKP